MDSLNHLAENAKVPLQERGRGWRVGGWGFGFGIESSKFLDQLVQQLQPVGSL